MNNRYFIITLVVAVVYYCKEPKRKTNILPLWKILSCVSLISFLGQIFVHTPQSIPGAF